MHVALIIISLQYFRVSDKLQLRITDSALSKDIFRGDYDILGTGSLAPIKWMSYEALNESVISTACDVVSSDNFEFYFMTR